MPNIARNERCTKRMLTKREAGCARRSALPSHLSSPSHIRPRARKATQLALHARAAGPGSGPPTSRTRKRVRATPPACDGRFLLELGISRNWEAAVLREA